MSAEPNPWGVLTGAIEPPPWRGDATVHRMEDEVPRSTKPLAAAPAPAPGSAPVAKPAREPKDDTAGIRTCSKCRRTYPATPEYFYRSKRELGGLRRECKACFGEHPSSKRQRRAAPDDEKSAGLQQLAKRAAVAILEILPPWTLIEPGSEKEAFARKVPACVWWQFPDKQWPFPTSAHEDQP